MVTHMCHNIFIQNCDDMDSQRLPASRLVCRSNGYSPFTSVHQRRAVHAGVRIENAGNLWLTISKHSHIMSYDYLTINHSIIPLLIIVLSHC